jgi:CubicO group peptidase (beta-lactamase class C family)
MPDEIYPLRPPLANNPYMFFQQPSRALSILPALFVTLVVAGCEALPEEAPLDLSEGVWVLLADANVFLWEFTSDSVGAYRCSVHDFLAGLKFMETPCVSVDLNGEALGLEMPNGVRYEGQVDLAGGLIDGSLLYTDGSGREAPLEWAPMADFPTLQPRPRAEGPYVYRVPESQEDGWPVSHASEKGVDSQALEGTMAAVLAGSAGFLKSILVLRGGALVLEEYFHGYGPDDLSPIQSCTKSVSSLLVGLAIQEGRITGVDVPLLDFFPEERDEAGSGWGDLTLQHLLTMSLALDWAPDDAQDLHGTGPVSFRQILARNVVGRPGRDWEYVSMNVNLLAGILHKATGEHAEAFAETALFGPLGITEWNWDYGKTNGFNLMDGSLRLRPRDMAKIGLMVMNGGVWKGHRVLEEEWVRRSLTSHLSTGSGGEGYGYLWWTMDVPGPDDRPIQVVFANGWGSQFILLFPELDLMVVTTGGNQENGLHMAIGEVLMQELLPGVRRNPTSLSSYLPSR